MLSKFKHGNISQQLIFLSVVFFIGFGAQFVLNESFNNLTKRMDAKIQNSVTQGVLGEEIIRHIKQIELYYFQISAIKHEKHRYLIEKKIRHQVSLIEQTLEVIENGGSFTFTKELNLPDKQNLQQELSYSPIKNSAFDILRIDITPKLLMIQDQTAELNQLIDLQNQTAQIDILLQKRIDSHIKRASPLFIRLLENANRVIFEQQEHLMMLKADVASKKATYETLQLSLSTLLLLLGMITFFVIGKNIQKITEDLRVQKDKALAATRSKSTFLANMSHEIRTPLNAILGFLNLMKAKELDNESQHFLRTIDKASQNLLDIINDILDFSKIETNKLSVEKITFSPKEAFYTTAELFKAKCSEKNLSLNVEIDNKLPEAIKTDPLRVKQIVSNLLSNAIKFSNESANIHLEIKYLKNDMLYISVQDEGIGIEKSKQTEIFKAFSQADSFTTRKYGGTGLGLAISSKLVEMLGGELQLESEIQKGSRFFFTIPVEKAEQQQKEIQPSFSMQKFKGHILLVEDNPTNQLLMTTILKKQNLTYTLANDGVEAVEAVKVESFDLILMDENMPNMNGIEATKRIKSYFKQTGQPLIPVIALTANAMKGDRERFLEAGMDEYLTKPLNMPAFFKLLQQYLPKS